MDHRVSKDMISKGMSVTGEKKTEELGGSQYGSVATPSSLMDAYSSMYNTEEKVEEDAKYGYDSKGNSLNPKDKKKSVKEGKKADKDYDGDGKIESGKEEYFGSKDKAIKKAMKKEGFSNWRHDLKEIPDYDQIPETTKDRNKKIEEKKVKNTVKINPNMEEGYGKKKKHDCASKVKH